MRRELLRRNHGIDVAGVVRVRHASHLFGQAVEGLDALVEVVLDGVEIAVVVIGDLRGDVALADFVYVVGRDIQRPDNGVQSRIESGDDFAELPAMFAGIGAGGQLAFTPPHSPAFRHRRPAHSPLASWQ
jgi:hypothetical protein